MSSRVTPPSVFCPDLTFVPRGPHEGKRPVPLNRPVNVISTPVPNVGGPHGATPLMSRVVVLNIDAQLYIRDLYGRANLRWNGEPVAEARLRHGDKVQLGKIEYGVVATKCDPSSAAVAVSPAPGVEIVTPGGAPPVRVRTPVTVFAPIETADIRLPARAGGGDACAMILRMGDLYWLWNLEPAAELRVNGQVVTRAELSDGSDVSVGGTGFRFRAIAAPTAAVPVKASPKLQQSKAAPPSAAPAKPPAKTPSKAPPGLPSGVVATFSMPSAPGAPSAPPADEASALPSAVPAKAAAKASPPVVVGRTRPAPAGKPRVTQRLEGDDADGIRHWGPLAFAVAAADRPELQGPQGPAAPLPEVAEESPARSRRLGGVLIVGVVVLALLAVAAFYGRKYLGF
jgi:hypothetical protein